jgi:UPF0755 protein
MSDQESSSTSPRREFHWGAFLVGAAIVAVAMWRLILSTGSTAWIDEPLGFEATEITVTVERGMSAGAIGRLLVREGVLPSARHWRALLRETGGEDRLRAGVYVVTPTMTPRELIALLQSPTGGGVRVTLVEGWTADQMAEALAEAGLPANPRDFAVAMRGHPRRASWAPEREDLEGYLFPDTYLFVPGMTAFEIVDELVGAFEDAVDPLGFEAAAAEQGLTLDEAVILASIVEREARIDDERPTIASVFLNRLEDGMKLESCATVHHAIGDWSRPLRIADTRIAHPHNTYVIDGLPPGPICNPGLASLRAVVSPEVTDHRFFVYDESLGRHRFSRTYAEHQRQVQLAGGS